MKKTKINKEKSSKLTLLPIILLIILILYTISLIVPLIWGFLTTFKTPTEFRVNPMGLPKNWVWNYSYIFTNFKYPVYVDGEGTKQISFGMQFLNTFLYAFGSAFVQTATQLVVAYLCAKFNYKFSKLIYAIVIIVMVIPVVGSLPSEIQMAKNFGLFDQIWGIWIMKLNFIGFYFLIFYNNIKAIPLSYTESAKIDGAGNFRIMMRIIFPLVKTTFLTILLLNFIMYWNDYQVPIVYLKSHPTISMGLFHMSTSTDNILVSVPMRMTSAMIVFLPILVLYIITNKRLLGSLTAGGIKG